MLATLYVWTWNILQLQFTSITDAERILELPDQFLDEDDEDSVIRVRPLIIPTREVLVTGESQMSVRMMRNYFKKHGDVVNVMAKGDERRQFIVTFTNAQGTWMAFRSCISLKFLSYINTGNDFTAWRKCHENIDWPFPLNPLFTFMQMQRKWLVIPNWNWLKE